MINVFENSESFYCTIDSLFNGEDTSYLFYHSPWDEQSVKLLKFIEENFTTTKHRFHIVNTFECPDAFNAIKPSRYPSLCILTDILKEQSIPAMIWRTLEILAKKSKKSKGA